MRKLFKLELYKLIRDPTFFIAMLTLVALVAVSVIYQNHGIRENRRQVQASQEKFAAKREQAVAALHAVENGESTYGNLWDDPRGYYTWQEVYISFPDRPLGFLATGQADLYEPAQTIDIYKPVHYSGGKINNPTTLLWGSFDPAFVLAFLLPLLLVVLGFRFMNARAERAPLALVFSQPISPRRFFLIKLLALFLPVTVLVGITVPFVLVLAGANPFAHLPEVTFIFVLLVLYTFFWLGVCLLFNVVFPKTKNSALGLFALWVVTAVMLPAGISTVSSHLFPPVSRIEWVGDVRKASREIEKEASEVLAAYYRDHPELAVEKSSADEAQQSFFDYYKKSLTIALKAEAMIQSASRKYEREGAVRQRFENWLSYFSPTSLMQQSLEAVAGASGAQHGEFGRALKAFHTRWRRYFQNKAFSHQLISSQDLSAMPEFRYSLARIPDSAIARLVALVLLDLALLAGIWVGLRRGACHQNFVEGNHV